jgi:hypothetical protein
MVEIVETIEMVEIVQIANTHAAFMHSDENMTAQRKSQGEYPTLSAILVLYISQALTLCDENQGMWPCECVFTRILREF